MYLHASLAQKTASPAAESWCHLHTYPAPWVITSVFLKSIDVLLTALQVVGYIFCTVRTLVLHVGKLAVVPQFRRQGLGRALLQVCQTSMTISLLLAPKVAKVLHLFPAMFCWQSSMFCRTAWVPFKTSCFFCSVQTDLGMFISLPWVPVRNHFLVVLPDDLSWRTLQGWDGCAFFHCKSLATVPQRESRHVLIGSGIKPLVLQKVTNSLLGLRHAGSASDCQKAKASGVCDIAGA
jgi:hypothetical protein